MQSFCPCPRFACNQVVASESLPTYLVANQATGPAETRGGQPHDHELLWTSVPHNPPSMWIEARASLKHLVYTCRSLLIYTHWLVAVSQPQESSWTLPGDVKDWIWDLLQEKQRLCCGTCPTVVFPAILHGIPEQFSCRSQLAQMDLPLSCLWYQRESFLLSHISG